MDAHESSVYTATLIAANTIGIMLVLFLLTTIRLHRRYNRLQRTLSESHIVMMEQERARIAADLHDDLGPILSATKFKLSDVKTRDNDSLLLLDTSSKYLDTIINRIREISNALMPGTLIRKGPIKAIEELILTFYKSSGLDVFISADKLPPLKENSAINIYRILQQAIHNAIRHSAGSRVDIEIRTIKKIISIVCRDNGKGFNTQQILRERRGLGLHNMLLRTEMLKGSMSINSKEGLGTTLYFEFRWDKL